MFKPELSTSVNLVVGKGLKDGEYRYGVDENFPKLLKNLKEKGFKAVELDVCGMLYAWVAERCLNESLEIAKDIGITVNSVHYPFGEMWNDLASPWKADRKEIVKWFGKLFKITDKYGVRAHVLHPGGLDVTKENYSSFINGFYDSVNGLTKQTAAFVCIENMIVGELLNTVDKVEEMLTAVRGAYTVLDVNHLLYDKPQDAVRRLKGKIKTLHISDYDFVKERHEMPKTGKIDWNDLILALEEVGYDGRFNYELDMAKHGYTYDDIKVNYEELFSDYAEFKSKN